MNSNEIIDALSELSYADLRRVKMATATLLMGQGKDDESMEGTVLWRCLSLEAEAHGIWLPRLPLANAKDWPAFQEYAQHVMEFLFAAVGPPQDKMELVDTARLAARAIIGRVKMLSDETKLQVTPRVVMQQTAHGIAAIQAAWPGGPEELQLVLRR